MYNLVFPSAKQGGGLFLVTASFIGKALSDHIESGRVGPCSCSPAIHTPLPEWVNLRRTQYEHMFSASLSNSDIARGTRLVKGARNGSRGLFDHLVGEREQRQWHFDAERLRGVEVEIDHSCRIFRPDLPAEEFCRAGLRPSGRGGGGISRGSIVPPGCRAKSSRYCRRLSDRATARGY